MRKLDYQTILDRLYRHFVIDRHPPGVNDGYISYHQTNAAGNDCPCAIGLFDTDFRLDNPQLCEKSVDEIVERHADVLTEVFKIDDLTWHDVCFLDAIQQKHDFLAGRYPPDVFIAAFSAELEQIATRHGLKPLAV